uniref:efflux RND transporter periplasmic adaptor subunit n=1 Tax=Sphaerotilus montanus TaxID=522889 RepID=UPI003FA285D6
AETPHRADLGVQPTGTATGVAVAPGSLVQAGDALVELRAVELQATETQAAAALTQAQARLRQLLEVQAPVAAQGGGGAQAGLAPTAPALRRPRRLGAPGAVGPGGAGGGGREPGPRPPAAHAALRRQRTLFARGFVGQAALDETIRAADTAGAQVRTAQLQRDTTRPAGSDHALATAGVASAQAGLHAARARTAYSVLRAPVAGTLIGRDVEVGDVVQPGKVLLTLSPAGTTQLVVAIDERNLGLLALHQPAVASADAYAQERFAAVLASIYPSVNAQTGAVEVRLDVPAPPATLRQDMTVSVDIEVARRPKALLVPTGAVHDAGTATPWVLRVEAGHAVRRAVRLGLHGGAVTEVLDGLQEGDAVLPVSAATTAGARVRVQPPARTD